MHLNTLHPIQPIVINQCDKDWRQPLYEGEKERRQYESKGVTAMIYSLRKRTLVFYL